MGICGEDKIKKEDEQKTIPIKNVNKLMKSICKITKENTRLTSTGFFINSNSMKYLIITNSSIINLSTSNDTIEVETWNKKKMKLNIKNRAIKLLEKTKDIIAIEIKDSDEIYSDIILLDYDTSYKEKGYMIYKGMDIYTIKHPFEKDSSYVFGKIVNINNYEFEFNISVDIGTSGYPILLSKNINIMLIIGIQKDLNNSNKLNTGIFIGELFKDSNTEIASKNTKETIREVNNIITKPIQKDLIKEKEEKLNKEITKDLNKGSIININKPINEQNKNNLNQDNYILAEIFVKDEDLNNDIKIINSYEEYMRKNCPSEKLEEKEKNEDEITKCEIEINNQSISFNYYHKFDESGKYIIKYSFKNNLTKINYMFGECETLTNINLSNFNCQNVTNMSWMFGKCKSLNNIDLTNINTQNAKDLSGIFYKCNSLANINLTTFNTQNVINMTSMFKKCELLTEIDLTNFNTQKVIDMSGMFDGCSSLINLSISNFNTQKVIDMSGMFDGCKSITNINLSNFNTENVTNMSCMFCECKSLTTVNISNFNTQNVTNIYCMFFNCKSLKNIDLSHFNTKNMSDMSGLFYGCDSLVKIDLNNFNTQKVTDMSEMFYGCKFLSSVNLGHFKIQNNTNIDRFFAGCVNLKKEDVKTSDNKIIQAINSK